MNSPLVSVIMPAYNAAEYIAQSIESVQKQSLTNWECLVADDQSTDETVRVVEEICQKDPRVKLIRCPQKMYTALARNEALKIASGRYIAFLDSDDLWAPEKLQCHLEFMKEKEAALSFHSYQFIDNKSNKLDRFVHAPAEVSFQDLLGGNSMGCLTVIYDTEKLGKVFMLDGFHTREDYVCWLGILKKIPKAYGLDKVLSFYRIHPSASSSSKLTAAKRQWKVYRNFLKFSAPIAAYWMFHYSLHGIKKHGRI